MKTKFFEALVLVLGFTAVFSSCDKNEEMLNTQNTEKKQCINPLTAAEGTAISKLRSSSSLYTRGEEAYPSEGEIGTNFYFKFRGSPTSIFNQATIQIRFYPPQGGSYIFDMDRIGEKKGETLFEYERELSQTGTYRFEYGYSLKGSNFTAFNATFFVKVSGGELDPIPLVDDYDSSNDSNYPNGYCTAWVAWKVNQMWGTYNEFPKIGNAKDWRNALVSQGYQSDMIPQVGDIAWWDKNIPGCSRELGHVAFVNKIIDNNTVEITEYNFPGNKVFNKRRLNRYETRSKGFPSAFIHVQQKID